MRIAVWKRSVIPTVLCLALVGLSPATSASAEDDFPFGNPDLPLQTRIDDLLGRMTLEERISLLHQFPLPVPRLGITEFRSGTEALHGVAWTTDYRDGSVKTATATTFPQAVGLASTWDTELIEEVGSAVGDEARGYNSIDSGLWGLNMWAPVVNLLRDPRWGRNEEGYSEDPLLTGAISTAYGSGMTGDDPFYLKTAPTLKHYLANNNEVNRATTSSNLSPRVLHEYDEMAFKPAIEAGAATGVMASYNLVNGRPNTVNPDLNDAVRSWTDQTLFNVSDAGAPGNLVGSQQYYATQPEADAATLLAGIDSFTMNDNNPRPTIDAITAALDLGLITEADINEAASHNLSIRFRLGEFDPDGGPYADITADVINSSENQALTRETADEAMVLLKNSDNTLPLDAETTQSVAVIGPLENTLYTDWYGGNQPYSVTPLQGITDRLAGSATVTGTEGVDRIALKDVGTGRYVVGGSGPTGAALTTQETTADSPTAQFDVFDWGDGIVTLRSVANGKLVGYNWSGFANDQAQPNGWFVQQQFKLEEQPDGTYVLRYAGYEAASSWSPSYTNPYVTVGADGALVLGAATPDAATKFSREVLVSGQETAAAAAAAADVAVVVVGSMPFINGREDHDRATMDLAEGQEALAESVIAANPNTIVVLETSYPMTITDLQESAPAILWTTHAGQETGNAVADVLFGDVNPAGRLTQTWYNSLDDLPADLLNYDIINTQQTYLYDDTTPLYPFGYGLSYTSFDYSNLRLSSRHVRADGTVTVSVDITNTGSVAGDEVVQLYTHQRTSRDTQPLRQLRAFDRVSLEPGARTTVRLELPAADLAHWDVTRDTWVVETSAYDIMVGASSADIRRSSVLHVAGERIPPRDLSATTPAQNFDQYSGIDLVDTSRERGTSIQAAADGSWVSFDDARLRSHNRTFTVSAANAGESDATVEVRLDSPTGRLLGTVTVPSTGDIYAYTTATATLRRGSGIRDVYLVLSAGVRVAEFTVS